MTIDHQWRFAAVLLASFLLAVAQPLTSGLVDEQGSFDFVFSVLIVTVLLLLFEKKEHRQIAILLGLTAFLAIWVSRWWSGSAGQLILVTAHLLAVSVFGFALYEILRTILVCEVSGDAIWGAVCGYLLLGIIWSFLYSAVETFFPGSFRMPDVQGAVSATALSRDGIFNYYSFITLTTLGYGDVTPTTVLARTLAWMEAVTGQVYLAVLVAGLVGLKVTQASKR